MDPNQILDNNFPNCLHLVVGACTSVPIPAITTALNTTDVAQAVATFQNWSQIRGLLAVQLTVNVMMVGRRL